MSQSGVFDDRHAILAAIIDSSHDAIISKDLSSRITSWNRAAEQMFGYSEYEMIGQQVHRLIPPDRQSEEDQIIASLKSGKRVEHFETVRIKKDGSEIKVSLMISPIKDAEGNIIGASKIARDITQQRLNEERLQLINDLGRSISSHLDIDKILQVVTDATTKLCTAAFGAFFYNMIDAKGETYMLYALSGAPKEAFEKFGMPRNTKIFNPTFTGESIVRSDNILLDPRYGKNAPHKGMPEGHLPVVSYLAVPVISHTGVVIGGLFFGHPKEARFTEEHESLISAIAAQAAIALDNAKLYQEISILNSKKDQFIGFASHELKTPIATLRGYLDIFEIRDLPIRDFLPKLRKQVDRLQEIVGELLDVSMIQAGKQEYQFEKIDLNALITDACESIGSSGREIQIDMPKEKVEFVGDYKKLGHVLANLLTNAVKYSEEGTPILIKAIVFGDDIQVSVQDYGIGIAKEFQSEIFSQYFRTTGGRIKAKGMGLGLFISKEIVEAHTGRIWVESELGKGATFFVTIPLNAQLLNEGMNSTASTRKAIS